MNNDYEVPDLILPNAKVKMHFFTDNYKIEYLTQFGVFYYEVKKAIPGIADDYICSLRTKHGEMIAFPDDVVMYKGHKQWEIINNDD